MLYNPRNILPNYAGFLQKHSVHKVK